MLLSLLLLHTANQLADKSVLHFSLLYNSNQLGCLEIFFLPLQNCLKTKQAPLNTPVKGNTGFNTRSEKIQKCRTLMSILDWLLCKHLPITSQVALHRGILASNTAFSFNYSSYFLGKTYTIRQIFHELFGFSVMILRNICV